MDLDPLSLFLGFVFSVIGYGIFRYGKQQTRPLLMVSGVSLMIFPYFVSSHWLMLLIGIGLIALPYLF